MRILFSRSDFLFGLSVRLLLLGFVSTGVMTDLFIPFVDGFLENPRWNPWADFPSHYFPYGSFLLLPFVLVKGVLIGIFGEIALSSNFLSYVAMKLPLLVFDIGLLLILKRMSVAAKESIIKYYWLNPVLIYITYIHGQLDVVPIFFATLSLYLLIEKKHTASAVLMGVASVCKLNTLLLVPLMLAYLWNAAFMHQAVRKIAKWFGSYLLVLFIGFMPQIISWVNSSQNLQDISFGHQEALKLFSFGLHFDDSKVLFIGFLFVVLLLIRLVLSSRISPPGLIYSSGLLFASLLVVTPAMPGWYFWFFPFVALFYANYSLPPRSIFWSAVMLYLAHFLVFPLLELPTFLNHYMQGILFSLLQATIVLLGFLIWYFILRFEVPLERRIRPLVFGLAGDSGSGKNHLTKIISDLFGEKNISLVEGDDYHKWERGDNQWQDYTHLDPKANFLDHMSTHTQNLLSGRLVEHHHYDHSTGRFSDPRSILSKKVLILQGLHSFYQKSLRQTLDIKIFLAPDEELRVAWKVLRDVKLRGYDFDRVMNSIASRKLDFIRHIEPQKEFADWILEYKLCSEEKIEYQMLNDSPKFYVRHVVWNDIPLTELTHYLEKYCSVRLERTLREKNIDQVNVVFHGGATSEQIRQVAEASFPNLRRLTQARVPPSFYADQDGFAQLICLALIERSQVEGRL